jgi:hypothetical protein
MADDPGDPGEAAGGADGVGPGLGGAGGGTPSGPGPQPQGMPQGGGPMINAIMRRQQGPQPSAPGPGDAASSMTMIMQAIAMLQQALPGLPPGSPAHKDVLKAAQALSRHAPQGAPGAGVQQTQLQDLLKNVIKSALLQRVMANQGGGPGGGGGRGGGASPLPGASVPAPMPSTPLPGA